MSWLSDLCGKRYAPFSWPTEISPGVAWLLAGRDRRKSSGNDGESADEKTNQEGGKE